MLKYILNGLIKTFGKELIEEWIPLDHICVTSVGNPEIHLADISIPEVVFQNYSSPFALVSSNIHRIVVKCDWSAFFRNNRKGKIRIDVDGVDLIVRAKRLDELDPDLCKELYIKKKKRYLDKWIKYSTLGPGSDKAARFVNCLAIRVRNVKITFVDDVIYKNPFAIVIKADLVTGGGVDSKNPGMNDLERKGFLKNMLTNMLFRSKGVQIEYNSYESDFNNYEQSYPDDAPVGSDSHDGYSSDGTDDSFDSTDSSFSSKDNDGSFNTPDPEDLSSGGSNVSDELFESDFSEKEELENEELNEFLEVKRSNFCTFCSSCMYPETISKNKIKPDSIKYINILNTPHKRFKLTTKQGIFVAISVKIWNFNSVFFVDKIAYEPIQKIKLYLCGNDPESVKQEHYGYIFDGSVNYSQLKLNFSSEFVHTLHDFIRYVRILSSFKKGATADLWKMPNVQNSVKYCKLLKSSKMFNLSKEDQDFFDTYELETPLGLLIRLRSLVSKKRRKIIKLDSKSKVKPTHTGKRANANKQSQKSKTTKTDDKNTKTTDTDQMEHDLGIKIERLFQDDDEYEDEYNEQFIRNFINIEADEYESNFFNSNYYDYMNGTDASTETKPSQAANSNDDYWFLGSMGFGIIAPNLRVDLVPTSGILKTFTEANRAKTNQKRMLDCIIADVSNFYFNIVQMSDRRSSIKIYLARAMCRYAKVECHAKKHWFRCDLVLGNVHNEMIVAAPSKMLDGYTSYFEEYGGENVELFSIEEFDKIAKYSLISILIESYDNYVKKNLINMCSYFVIANPALLLYKAVEQNLLSRCLNELLSFELYLHRNFVNNHTKCYRFKPTDADYPFKSHTRYSQEDLKRIDKFIEKLDQRLKFVIVSTRYRMNLKNRNMVRFTGMEMKMYSFFTRFARKRTRPDARDLYEKNEEQVSRWPYQTSLDYFTESGSNKRNSRSRPNKSNDVVINIGNDPNLEETSPDSVLDHWEDVDWFYNSRSIPFCVESLDLGFNNCIQVSLTGIDVLVDSYLSSRKLIFSGVNVSISNFYGVSEVKNIINQAPKSAKANRNSASMRLSGFGANRNECGHRTNLLNVQLFSFQIIKNTGVILVGLEDVELYSTLVVLVPFHQFVNDFAKSGMAIKDMVDGIRDGSCYPTFPMYFQPKSDFLHKLKGEDDFFGADGTVKQSKELETAKAVFNLITCYCPPVYEPDLIRFHGDYDNKVLVSVVDFKIFFIKHDKQSGLSGLGPLCVSGGTHSYTSVNSTDGFDALVGMANEHKLLYSLVFHKFTLQVLAGAKQKVKFNLKGAHLLGHSSAGLTTTEYESLSIPYQESVSSSNTDFEYNQALLNTINNSASSNRAHGSNYNYLINTGSYEVLFGCSMGDLKNNKITTKRVQHGQVLMQLERHGSKMDVKLELRSLNFKYSQQFAEYCLEQFFFFKNLVPTLTSVKLPKKPSTEYSSKLGDSRPSAPNAKSPDRSDLHSSPVKVRVSCLSACVFLDKFGVVFDVFCDLTKATDLSLNVARLSTALLWSNYSRFVTLSMMDLKFKLDDFNMFSKGFGNMNSSAKLSKIGLMNNKIVLQISQLALWYHYSNSYKSFNSSSELNKFSSTSSTGTKFTDLKELFYELSLLFNEYWFSHVTWCLLPTCQDEDLLILIFSTKVCSYSRLKPVLNSNYVKHYMKLSNFSYKGTTKEDDLIDEFLNGVDVVEKYDSLQLDTTLTIHKFNTVITTKGTVKVGEFLFNFDVNMLKEVKQYVSELEEVVNSFKTQLRSLKNLMRRASAHYNNVGAGAPPVKILHFTNFPSMNDYAGRGSRERGDRSRKKPVVFNIDFSLNGNASCMFSDYSLAVPCCFLPEVTDRYQNLRFRLLKLYPQSKITANFGYSFNFLLQNNLNDDILYKLSRHIDDNVGGAITHEGFDAKDNTIEYLYEQYYTFKGNLIFTVSNCNFVLDMYAKNPSNLGSSEFQHPPGDPNQTGYLDRLSSINIFEEPLDEFELVKIFNLTLSKKFHFVRSYKRLVVKLLVENLQILDYFGKHLLLNVHGVRYRASQHYYIPQELVSKQREQVVLSFSKTPGVKKLNVVIDNTMAELQPDFINLLISIYLNHFKPDLRTDGTSASLSTDLKTGSITTKFGSNEFSSPTNEYQLDAGVPVNRNVSNEPERTPTNPTTNAYSGFGDLNLSLTLNLFEVWIYPSIDFYTRTKNPVKEQYDKKIRVVPRVFMTARETKFRKHDPQNASKHKESVDHGDLHEDYDASSTYYDDRLHIVCILFSGTLSTAKHCQCYLKYISATLGAVLILENNLKVLVDQNDALILSRSNDPCNRFLFELRDLSIKFKLDPQNLFIQSELETVKVCNSVEDIARLCYLKDYFYPEKVKDLMALMKKPEEAEEPEAQEFYEFEYSSLDEIFKSMGVTNIHLPTDGAVAVANTSRTDSVNSGTRPKSDDTEQIKKSFKTLDKLCYSGKRKISMTLVASKLQLVMFTSPDPMIFGVLLHELGLDLYCSSSNEDSSSALSVSFMCEVALLNNKFCVSDSLMQPTPFQLEMAANGSNDKEYDRHIEGNVLMVNLELGSTTVDFSNNMRRLVRYVVATVKSIREIEKSIELKRITVYNDLEYDVCVFSGNIKRELDYFVVPSNASVKLFAKEFSLLIKNQENLFSNCENLLGYIDNNLLYGNTNNVRDFISLHNYSNNNKINAANRRMTAANIKKNDSKSNFIYLGRFEGNENILKLPSVGEVILVEKLNDKVVVTTNIKLENLTDIPLVIRCRSYASGRRKSKLLPSIKEKINELSGYAEKMSETGEVVLDKFTSVGIPVSWYVSKFTPFITYADDRMLSNYANYGSNSSYSNFSASKAHSTFSSTNVVRASATPAFGGSSMASSYDAYVQDPPAREDYIQFDLLKNLLSNPAFSRTTTSYYADAYDEERKQEFLLRFRNGLCFKSTLTSTVVNDINGVDCLKYLITVEPMFKIVNKLPFDLVVYFSTLKQNASLELGEPGDGKQAGIDLFACEKVGSMSIIQNNGAIRLLRPNHSWGIPVNNTKFYLKLLMKGSGLVNTSSSAEDEGGAQSSFSSAGNYSKINFQSNSAANMSHATSFDSSSDVTVGSSSVSRMGSSSIDAMRVSSTDLYRDSLDEPSGVFRGDRFSISEFLNQATDTSELAERQLLYQTDLFEVNLPISLNLVATKCLDYRSGPLDETTLRHFEPLLSQGVYSENKEAFYDMVRKSFVNIRLDRGRVSIFWPYIFENFTDNFISLNGNLIPPYFKFFTTTSQSTNTSLRAYVNYKGGRYLPTRELSKLDFTSTTITRPPINLPFNAGSKKAAGRRAAKQGADGGKLSGDETDGCHTNLLSDYDLLTASSYDYVDARRKRKKHHNSGLADKTLDPGSEFVTLGCTVRALNISACPTKIVSFHNYFTFVNNMKYSLVVKNLGDVSTLIPPSREMSINTRFRDITLLLTDSDDPAELDRLVKAPHSSLESYPSSSKVRMCKISLIPPKIPFNIQIGAKYLNRTDTTPHDDHLILDINVVAGKFENGLPCKFNGLYFIVCVARETTYQLLNMTSFDLHAVDPNYLAVINQARLADNAEKTKGEPNKSQDDFVNFEKIERENTFLVSRLKLTPYVLFDENDRRVAFKNARGGDWLTYNIDTIKTIDTYKIPKYVATGPSANTGAGVASTDNSNSNPAVDKEDGDPNNPHTADPNGSKPNLANFRNSVDVYVSCIMKKNGTRVICFLDNYILLCKLMHRVELLQMNRINSVWSKIVFNIFTPRITTTMSNKKKMVLAAHINNVQLSLALINNSHIANIKTTATMKSTKYTIRGTNDWVLDVAASVSGCHVDHFVQGFIPVILKTLANRHSVQESFVSLQTTCTIFSKSIQTFDNILFKVSPVSVNLEMRVIEQIVDYFESLISETLRADSKPSAPGTPKNQPVASTNSGRPPNKATKGLGAAPTMVIAKNTAPTSSFTNRSSASSVNPTLTTGYESENAPYTSSNSNLDHSDSSSSFGANAALPRSVSHIFAAARTDLPIPSILKSKKKDNFTKRYFKKFVIDPVTVILAIRTSDVKLTRQGLQILDALPVDTPSLCIHFFAERINQSVYTFDELLSILKNSYFKQLVRQSLPTAWLSNSLALVYGVVKGLLYLLTQPFNSCRKFKSTFQGFFVGLNNGVKYFVLFVFGGIAQSVGHWLNIFYKLLGRGRAKPVGIIDGLWYGLNSLLLDIFYNPWRRLVSEFYIGSGIRRVFRNSYNVFKCLLSPLTALVNLLVNLIEGLSNVLLGDFEQFARLYETEQLNSVFSGDAPSSADEGRRKTDFFRRIRSFGRLL